MIIDAKSFSATINFNVLFPLKMNHRTSSVMLMVLSGLGCSAYRMLLVCTVHMCIS